MQKKPRKLSGKNLAALEKLLRSDKRGEARRLFTEIASGRGNAATRAVLQASLRHKLQDRNG
jgi:hypothetical protein